jgi:GAF domain-containing protein
MEEHNRLLVPDISDHAAVVLGLGGLSSTYLGVAVYAGTKNLGILCVDAPQPGSLEESDVDIAAALAQMLGPGLALD